MSTAANAWKSVVSSGVLGEYSQDGLTVSLNAFTVGATDTPPPSRAAGGGGGAAATAAAAAAPGNAMRNRPVEKRAWASLFSPADKTAAAAAAGIDFGGRSIDVSTPVKPGNAVAAASHTDKKKRMGAMVAAQDTPDYNAAANRIFEEAAERDPHGNLVWTTVFEEQEDEGEASKSTNTDEAGIAANADNQNAAVAAAAAAAAAASDAADADVAAHTPTPDMTTATAMSQQEIGEALYPLVQTELASSFAAELASLAGKITGMLLDGLEPAELLQMVQASGAGADLVKAKVKQAVDVLRDAGVASPANSAAPAAGAAAGAAAATAEQQQQGDDDANASPSAAAEAKKQSANAVPFEPLTGRKIHQRERQIDLGKMTTGYASLVVVVVVVMSSACVVSLRSRPALRLGGGAAVFCSIFLCFLIRCRCLPSGWLLIARRHLLCWCSEWHTRYKNYCKVVEASRAIRGDPQTPDPRKPCSKRSFDGMCIKWRRELHKFDNWDECEQMIVKRNETCLLYTSPSPRDRG